MLGIILCNTAYPTDRLTVGAFEGGLVAGYQWIFNSGLQLDLFIGPAITSVPKITVPVQDLDMSDYVDNLSGFGTKFGFSIGYCF